MKNINTIFLIPEYIYKNIKINFFIKIKSL